MNETLRNPKIGVSGILYNKAKYLLGLRLTSDTQGGMWVTPGGGVELGESLEKALEREFLEETFLRVLVGALSSIQERMTERSHVVMPFYLVYCNDLTPLKVSDEFSDVRWFSFEEIKQLKLTNTVTDMTFKAIEELEYGQCRDGNWIDQWGACKVCDGEIPHGHTNNCDIFKLEQEITKLKQQVKDRTDERQAFYEKNVRLENGLARSQYVENN